MKKTITLALAAILPMLGVGCSQTSTVADNSVAAQFARSTPPGSILANDPATANAVKQAQTASANPNVDTILTALSAANSSATNPANAGVPSSLNIGTLLNSMTAAQVQAAAKAAQPKIGPAQGSIGPGPLFQPVSNNQQLQYVPAMSSPY